MMGESTKQQNQKLRGLGFNKTNMENINKSMLLKPTFWGWFLTFLIIILVAVYYLKYPSAFSSLLEDANELGGFLAGTAGTLALVWLIVGYFLQREEPHQNTNALLEQKEELVNQVTATNKMADSMLRMAVSNERLIRLHESQVIKEDREKSESVKPLG
jgi:hypothetical protein